MSKTLDRIALLLNQAENTDNEAEANAFMEKAQTLATAAQIELEVARQHQADKTKREVPEQRRVTVAGFVGGDANYYSRARVQNNAAERVQLFLSIAAQNSVKCNIAHNSTYVIAFGFPSDIDVCEALFASLVVQMTTSCDAEIKKGDYKKEKVEKYDRKTWSYVSKPMDARVFRTSFYQSFGSRIGARLGQARRNAEAVVVQTTDADTGLAVETTGALVLIPKAVEVSDFYARASNAKGSWKGGAGRTSSGSNMGYLSGRAAGDKARLGTERGITGGKGQIAS